MSASRCQNGPRSLQAHLEPKLKSQSASRNHLPRICFLRGRELPRRPLLDLRRSPDCSRKRPRSHLKSRRCPKSRRLRRHRQAQTPSLLHWYNLSLSHSGHHHHRLQPCHAKGHRVHHQGLRRHVRYHHCARFPVRPVCRPRREYRLHDRLHWPR